MLDFLHQLFSHVCGQNLAHTWSPGGEALPCCQRCTGVYVGAFIAALLHLARPLQPTSFWRWLNGAFLLFMVPSGFYWIPQNPELRAASGILFGSGLVAFLWLPLPEKFAIYDLRFTTSNHGPRANRKSQIVNAAALLAALIFTPLLGASENSLAAIALALLTAGGALALALLLAANLFLAARGLWRWFFQPASRVAA
jgi:uncharacterized membrane protein